MQRTLKLLPLLAAMLAGCTVTEFLYPVQGPLAAQSPPPVVRLSSLMYDFTLTLPDGETFKGKAVPVQHSQNPPNPMSAQWDLVFGPGYYVANVLGSDFYRTATLTGDRGSTMRIETATVGGTTQIGVAVDGHGNVFKLAL
jgi:hypothetical protein